MPLTASLYWTVLSVTTTSGAAWMTRSASETSKNTLPTASTLIRACWSAMFGTVTSAEPSFGVLAARTSPLSRLIFTSLVPTGATSVPATFQVTVCVVPARSVAGAACEVTRNGPANGASVSLGLRRADAARARDCRHAR